MKRLTLFSLALLIMVSGGLVALAQPTNVPPQPTSVPATAVPQSTPEAATEDMMAGESTPEVEADNAPTGLIRFAHWSPDAGSVDVYLDDEGLVSSATYLSITGYIPTEAGSYSLIVSPANTSAEESTTEALNFTLRAGQYVTLAAIGSAENGTLKLVAAVDDFRPIPFNSARIFAYHAATGAGSVDLQVGTETVITGLAYPGTFAESSGVLNDGAFSVNVPAGIYDIAVLAAGTTMSDAPAPESTAEVEEASDIMTSQRHLEGVVTDLVEFELQAGRIYTIVILSDGDHIGTSVSVMDGIMAPAPTAAPTQATPVAEATAEG